MKVSLVLPLDMYESNIIASIVLPKVDFRAKVTIENLLKLYEILMCFGGRLVT